ncbi:MAG TPA: autotransporter-associated beta strand repeat-containing protein, partial [Tepidisphaeraceae bacterium]|nr:autotransporter-associated beta strand repeat-containing protein [Tepidisphaeraceae bacterium]
MAAVAAAVAGLVTLPGASAARAATIIKGDSATLANAADWVGGTAPGPFDVAAFDATLSAANAANLTLGGFDLSWRGMTVGGVNGPVAIGGANTLTLGAAGIDMSGAANDLTISSNLTLGPGHHVWNVAGGRTLTLNTGTFTRAAGGATLNLSGTGTVAANMAGLANDASAGGGLIRWATVGTGADTRFATLSGGNLVGYTAGTASANFGYTSSATANYEVSGAAGSFGVSRSVNTVRYTGAAGTLAGTGNATYTFNGLMNAGTGTLTIQTTAGSGNLINVAIGSSNELLLVAANAGITINSIISGAAGARVTVAGPNAVLLSGANTYTGGTTVNSGDLQVSNNAALGTGALTINGGALTARLQSRSLSNAIVVNNDFTLNTTTGGGNNLALTGTVNLGGAVRRISVDNTGGANLAGVVSNGGIVKAGTGNLTLSGVNTYTGPTTIEAGTLTVGGAGSLNSGNYAGPLTNNAAFVYAGTANQTLSAGITGSGTLTKNTGATSVLTLSGANTYTGATAVNAGTLRLAPGATIANSAVTIGGANGSTLATGFTAGGQSASLGALLTQNAGGGIDLRDGFIGSLALAGGLTLNGGTLGFDVGAAARDVLSLTGGSYTAGGTNGVSIANLGATAGSYDLITGALGIDLANFSLSTSLVNGLTASLTVADTNADSVNDVLRLTLAAASGAPTAYWNVNGAATLSAAGFSLNADGTGPVNAVDANSALTFAANPVRATGVAKVATLTADQDVKTIAVNDTAPVTIDGAFNLRVVNPAGITVDAGAGGLTINTATVQLGASQTWTNNSAGALTVSAGVNGIGSGLTLAGSGRIVLSGPNTYTGGTTLGAGTLVLDNATALGTGQLTLTGGTLDSTNATAMTANNAQAWNGDVGFTGTTSLDMGTGAVTLGGTGDRTVTVAANTLTVGEIKAAGTQGLTKQGAGTLVVTSSGAAAASSVIGGTLNVAAGTLQINRTGDAGAGDFTATGLTGSGTITNGGSIERWLFVNTTANHTFAGTLADGGTGKLGLNKQGTGTLTLTGSSTYTGATNVSAGILNLQHSNALGGSPVSIRALTAGVQLQGGISLPSTVTFLTSNDGTGAVPYAIANVSGDNTINGTITMTDGAGFTVVRSDSGSLTLAGNVTNTFANGRAIILGGASTAANTVSGVISNGTGVTSVTKRDAGTWALSGANTYTGLTTVSAGTLVAASDSAMGSSTAGGLSMNPATATTATARFTSASPVIASLASSGAGTSEVVLGNATAGAATILSVGGASTSTTFAGTIGDLSATTAAATGGLTKAGTGTLTLTGVSTYTGPTAVNDGTLLVSGSGSINSTSAIAVNGPTAEYVHTSAVASTRNVALNGGTLDGTGTVGAVTVSDDAANVLTHGNGGTGPLTLSSLTFTGDATVNLRAGTTAPVLVTGALKNTPANGQVTINPSNTTWTSGLNRLIGYGAGSSFSLGGFTLAPTIGLVGRQSSGGLVDTGSAIAFQVNSAVPVWTGANGGVWTTGTTNVVGPTPSWALLAEHTPTDFWPDDEVQFNDTVNVNGVTAAPTTTTATIAGGSVSPLSVTFNNSALNFTVASSDGSGIAAGTVVKNGSGAVTITTANSYAGGTTLNAGTLNANNASALGTGTVTVNGGTLDNTTGAAVVLSTNNAQAWNGDFTFAGLADGTHDLNMGNGLVTIGGTGTRTVTVNAGTLTVGRITSTAQDFTKAGAGTLAITTTTPSTIGGKLTVSGGTLQINTGADTASAHDFTATGLAGAGTIVNGGGAERWLIITNAGTDTFNGTLANGEAGALGLSKQGAGTLTLTGANTHTGLTSAGGGTLAVTGTLGNTPIAVNGGTLSLQAAGAVSQNTVTVSGAGQLVQTVDNAIGGTASLVVQNSSVTLARPNNYSGQTTINAGTGTTLTVTHAQGAGTGRFNLATGVTNAVLNLHIDGGGTIAMPNFLGGNTGVSSTIDVNNNGSGTNGTIVLNGTAVANQGYGNGTLNVTGGNGYNLSISNLINNAGSPGTTTFNPTTANLTIGSYTSSTAFDKVVQLGGTSSGNAITGVISNGQAATLSLTKSNTSTWVLGGANTYNGATTVTGGTLRVNGSVAASSGVAVATGGRFVAGSTQTIKSLNLSAGSGQAEVANVPASLLVLTVGDGSTTATALQLGAASKLDLRRNAMVVDYAGGQTQPDADARAAAVAAVRAAIVAGLGGDDWAGATGITSSDAAASVLP